MVDTRGPIVWGLNFSTYSVWSGWFKSHELASFPCSTACKGSADCREDQYEEQMRLCYFLGSPQPHGNSIPSPHGPMKSLSIPVALVANTSVLKSSLKTCSVKCPDSFTNEKIQLRGQEGHKNTLNQGHSNLTTQERPSDLARPHVARADSRMDQHHMLCTLPTCARWERQKSHGLRTRRDVMSWAVWTHTRISPETRNKDEQQRLQAHLPQGQATLPRAADQQPGLFWTGADLGIFFSKAA